MTDREEFEKWFKAEWNADYYPTEAMYLAWQARGELEAVRIKELEIENHALGLIIDNEDKELADKTAELSLQVAQLREAFAECLTVTPHYMVSKATAEKWKALAYGTSIPSQDEWVRKSEIGELAAKLDKARDGDCCTEGCIKCDARKILAETQEPVAYQPTSQEQSVMHQAMIRSSKLVHKATPPSREWVGLSDAEIEEAVNYLNVKIDYPIMFARLIEMHLKEKNG